LCYWKTLFFNYKNLSEGSRNVGTTIKAFETSTGVKWQQQIVDLKRAGINFKDINAAKKLYLAGAKAAKLANIYGKVSFAIEASEAGHKVIEACKSDLKSEGCVKTVYEQTGALAFSQVGTVLGASAGTAICIGVTYISAGTASVSCELLVPPAFAISSNYAFGKIGEETGGLVYNVIQLSKTQKK